MNNDLISRSAILERETYMFDEALGWTACILTEDIKDTPAVDAVRFPCKVGDKVYYLFQYSNKRILPFVRTARVKKICCTNRKMNFIVEAELLDAAEKGILKSFFIEAFGKTVFLSKEEAELALKGGTQNVSD